MKRFFDFLVSTALVTIGILLVSPVQVDYIKAEDQEIRIGWCIRVPGGEL